MRLDPNKESQYRDDNQWDLLDNTISVFQLGVEQQNEGQVIGYSFSGNERNRLFLQADHNFDDATLVSGIDFTGDGRGFVIFDYDHDGFVDLGIVTTQRPRFRIAKNNFSALATSQNDKAGSVFLSLVGGNDKMESSDQWSPRDPFGARVVATVAGQTRMFQLSCGEGLAIQNSKSIHIGLGDATQIDKLEIIWPSGKRTFEENIETGQRRTLYENPKMRP